MIVLKAMPPIAKGTRLANDAEDVLLNCEVLPSCTAKTTLEVEKIASKHMLYNLKLVEVSKQSLWPKPRKNRIVQC